MKDFGLYEWVAYILVLIGGVNWGLVGLFNINLISAVLGAGFLGRIVFIAVGAAAGYLIYIYFNKKKQA